MKQTRKIIHEVVKNRRSFLHNINRQPIFLSISLLSNRYNVIEITETVFQVKKNKRSIKNEKLWSF